MKSYIPTLLSEFLGDIKKHNESSGQVSYNCIECDNGGDKGNLEVNYSKGVFKCWSCKDINNMYGSLYQLIKRYGTAHNLEMYTLLKPDSDYISIKPKDDRVLELPASFLPITNDTSEPAYRLKDYLYKRGIGDEIIDKYKMHYSLTVGFKGRILIPTYNEFGEVEYYVGRTIYDFARPKYRNADLDKEDIIMFEQMIDWESDVYIVEGVFDSIVIPNSIPILGKYISHKLLMYLREKCKAKVIICLDGDAYEDAVNLYNHLNILELYNRVRIIKLKGEWDMSSIYEKYGFKGVLQILKTAHKLT